MKTIAILLVVIIIVICLFNQPQIEPMMPANCTKQGYPGSFCLDSPTELDLPPVCPPGQGITKHDSVEYCLPFAVNNNTWKPANTN